MAKVCLISDLHLVSNPRLWKEAIALSRAGYEVVILTVWTSDEKRKRDKLLIQDKNICYKAGVNLIKGEVHPIRRFYYRFRHRLAVEVKRFLGIDTSWILGYAPEEMTGAAIREQADLYICHSEFGILIGRNLVQKGCKVAYDIEDWYSRDYLVPTRPVKLLEKLEAFALQHGVYCSCPSQSMADALNETYSGKPVNVIYNSFSINENYFKKSASSASIIKLVWFSQTIGEGRGLESLIDALTYYNGLVELHLLGDCSREYKNKLKLIFPFQKGHQLVFHDPVPHNQLIRELAQYDIGLALEKTYPESRNTTITNKALQYVQAGLKILATETKGQTELASLLPSIFELVPQQNIKAIACALAKLSDAKINQEEILAKFNLEISWEAQETRLLSYVDTSLKRV